MYPFIFQWGSLSDFCNHHTVTGKHPKSSSNFLLSGTRVSRSPLKAVGRIIRKATQAERPHMTSPEPSAFNNQELHGLQRDRRAGSKSITWEQSAPGSQWVCTSPLRVPAPAPGRASACGVAQGFPGHCQMPGKPFGRVQKWQEQAAFKRGFFFPLQVLGVFCSLPRPAVNSSTASSTFHPPPTPSLPKTDLKCQDLQLGPRPNWIPAQGREAAGG